MWKGKVGCEGQECLGEDVGAGNLVSKAQVLLDVGGLCTIRCNLQM